jgi:hypothetical protein
MGEGVQIGSVGVGLIGVSAARASVGAGMLAGSSPASLPISGTGVSVAAGIIGDVSASTVCNAPGVGDTICSTPGSSVSSRPISSVPQPANSKTASENPANQIQVNSRVLATDILATDVLATDVLATDVLATDVLATDVLATDALATDALAIAVLVTDVLAITVLVLTALIARLPAINPRSTIAFLLVVKPPVHIRSTDFAVTKTLSGYFTDPDITFRIHRSISPIPGSSISRLPSVGNQGMAT